MSTSATSIFTGTSTYSQDLQNVISREVQIASLPITQLQNNVSQLTGQSTELQNLSARFSALQAAVSNLSQVAGQMLSVKTSNSSAVQPTLGNGAAAGSYTIAVTSLGSYSNALSTDGLPLVQDPSQQSISTSGSYTLTVNGQTIQPPIQPSGPGLNELVQAINNADAGVHATVVNVGGSTPDYRLSLQSDQYGDLPMQLNDGHDLLAAAGGAGQPVVYSLNGKAIPTGSRNVILAPGLTVNLTGTTGDTPATITVAPDSTSVGNALSSFASAYNSAVDELNHNRGQGGGALAGQSLISTLAGNLHNLTSYGSGGSGALTSLASLGLTFDDTTGHLSFDASAFASAASNQLDALSTFLGAPDSGGFLQMATDTLNGITEAGSGTLPSAVSAAQSEIDHVNQQISDKQDQVNQLQQNLTQQMAAADALIASMQQQAIYFNDMFTAMRAAQTGTTGTAG